MYTVEGNIGAGKTTFLRLMQERLPYVSVAWEPVKAWQKSVTGQSLLANFYQDPKRWTYTFEMFTLLSRIKEEQNWSKGTCLVTERSIYSGYHCFARNNYDQGYMTTLEWQLYKEWFAFMSQHTCNKPRGIIYLAIDSDVAYKRVKKRNRHAEQNLTCAYIKQIGRRYEDYLINNRKDNEQLKNVPILILDANKEFESDKQLQQDYLDEVHAFMLKTNLVPMITPPQGGQAQLNVPVR
jgi:deoxyadenosine/deoxycytidine kinase